MKRPTDLTLADLKPQAKFQRIEDKKIYRLLIKYNYDRMTVQDEATKETYVFHGDLKVIPIPT